MARLRPVRHWVNEYVTSDGKRVGGHYRGSGKFLSKMKGASRVVGRGAKDAAKYAAYEAEYQLKKHMLEKCYKGTRAEKVAARVALRELYPELFDECEREAPSMVILKPRMIKQRW